MAEIRRLTWSYWYVCVLVVLPLYASVTASVRMFPFPSYVRFVSSRTVRVSPSTSVYVSFTGRPKSLYVYASSVVKVPPVRNDVLSVIFSISPYALYAYERISFLLFVGEVVFAVP